MKESIWGTFVVSLGIIGIGVLNVFQNITTTNESTYYLLKEVTEAAMYDAVDLGYYRMYGDVKIVEKKFVESFVRRFSQSFARNEDYTVGIYDVIEVPPKVSLSVNVGSTLQIYNYKGVDFDIENSINAILETKY